MLLEFKIHKKDKFFYGERESYYLNSIRTRTHTALFIKDSKDDGKGARQVGITGVSHTTSNISLQLNDILLFDNNTLQQTLGPLTVLMAENDNQNNRGDDYSKVLDIDDLISSGLWVAAKTNCIKRVTFNYASPANSLCKNTLNSFVDSENPPINGEHESLGKLTLESVSFRSASGQKLIPDYEFSYGNNPDYDEDKVDAYGMHREHGKEKAVPKDFIQGQYTFYTNPVYPDRPNGSGTEWMLTSILNPSGSTTQFEYERDEYSSISGYPTEKKFFPNRKYHFSGRIYFDDFYNNFVPSDYFEVGQSIKVHRRNRPDLQTLIEREGDGFCGEPAHLPIDHDVTEIGSNWIRISNPLELNGDNGAGIYEHLCMTSNNYGDYTLQYPLDVNPSHDFYGSIEISYPSTNVKGGDLRVTKVIQTDLMGVSYSTEYRYTKDGTRDGPSSGVISKVPESIRTQDRSIYHSYDFPNTPILYGKVTVIKGIKTNPNEELENTDFITSTEYNFEMPHYSMIERNQVAIFDGADYNDEKDHYKNYLETIEIRTSEIGRLNSTIVYNSLGHEISSTKYDYAGDISGTYEPFGDLGVYTDGNLFFEFYNHHYFDNIADNEGWSNHTYMKLFRTVKKKYPNLLYSMTKEVQGHSKRITNTSYDLMTAQVLETVYRDAFGEKYRTKMNPAYHYYPAMGSKYLSSTNKNMLAQPASEYLYVLNDGDWDVVSASVKTWSKDIAHRTFNTTTQQYENDTSNDIWHEHKSYVWSGNLNANGTYLSTGAEQFVDFTPADYLNQGGVSDHWLKASEVALLSDYSEVLSVEDLEGRNFSVKQNNLSAFSIAGANNANYSDIAFCGVEDVEFNGFLESEVTKSAQSSVLDMTAGSGSDKIHTGYKSLLVQEGEYGLTYRNYNYNHEVGYTVSVWVHEDGAEDAILAVQVYDNSDQTVQFVSTQVSLNTKKAGDWFLLSLDMPSSASMPSLVSGQMIEFKTYNPSGGDGSAVAMDDFLVHPTLSPISCTVFDQSTGLTLASIANNGLAVKVEYDDKGRPVRKHQEFFNDTYHERGFVLTQEYFQNNSRD